MIWMSIGSSIVEGENDVRLELANNLCGMANQLLLWNVLELAIAIVQATYVLHAELAAGAVQFLFARGTQGAAGSDAGVSYLASFAAGEGNNHHFGARGCIFCYGATNAKDFIVGMRE